MHIIEDEQRALLLDEIDKSIALIFSLYQVKKHEHPVSEYWCPVIEFHRSAKSRLHQSLMRCAAEFRIYQDLDIFPKDGPKLGILKTSKSKSQMDPRDVANKLIHNQTQRIFLFRNNQHPYLERAWSYQNVAPARFERPLVRLTGKLHKSTWECSINILGFLFHVRELANDS